MSQVLDRIIPTDDKHSVITESEPFCVELIPETLMNFRIPCKNKPSPLRIQIFDQSEAATIDTVDSIEKQK